MTYVAGLVWPTFVGILEYGTVGYIIAKGLLGTLRDVVDFLILILS